MARGPLPGETVFARPRSSGAREVLRFVIWLAAVAWFFAPPTWVIAKGAGAPLVAALVVLGAWIAGFIVLGRLSRGLAPRS